MGSNLMNLDRVVFTGGPSGGKSTALAHVPSMCSLYDTAPETATMLLSGGFPAPSETHPWTYAWQRSFQKAIAAGQVALEEVCALRAVDGGQYGILHDRGLPDGAAYLRGGMDELAELTNNEPAAMIGRYDLVIHLVSSAKQPRGYQKHTNQHRFEEASEAIRLDDKILEVWSDHPNRVIIDIEDRRERNSAVLEQVCSPRTQT